MPSGSEGRASGLQPELEVYPEGAGSCPPGLGGPHGQCGPAFPPGNGWQASTAIHRSRDRSHCWTRGWAQGEVCVPCPGILSCGHSEKPEATVPSLQMEPGNCARGTEGSGFCGHLSSIASGSLLAPGPCPMSSQKSRASHELPAREFSTQEGASCSPWLVPPLQRAGGHQGTKPGPKVPLAPAPSWARCVMATGLGWCVSAWCHQSAWSKSTNQSERTCCRVPGSRA